MKKSKNIGQIKSLIAMVFLCLPLGLQAQESTKLSFDAGLDIKSRYIWRGQLASGSPNLQPYMTLTWKGFSVEASGAYATSANYAEVDLSLSYHTGAFKFTICDAFTENESNMAANKFSDWNNTSTNHLVDASVVYKVPSERLPLSLTFSTLVYGADKDAKGNQNYSTYLKTTYPFRLGDYDMSVFCAGTFSKGIYAKEAGVVNVGASSTHAIKLSERFSVPLELSLFVNPKRDDVFYVVGISF